MNMIQVNGVSKWYGDVSALTEVSLEIDAGILGLLGPNGAGKSTLLKLMAGQLDPSIGEVLVMGRTYEQDPKLFYEIGFCPEQDSLWEEFSGPAFLEAMLRLHGWTHDAAVKRSRELIGLFDLEKAGKKRVGGYSKGMRQKLRIAQALAHKPRLLFLDEPMTGLDATSRSFVGDVLQDLADHNRLILVSSHILHEVEQLTKEMVLINHGSLRARGNIYEIRELLTDHPLQLELTVDKPKELARAFMDHHHIVRLEFDTGDPERMVVFTQHQNQFFKDLPGILEKGNIEIKSLHAEDEDMEAVFKYLTK